MFGMKRLRNFIRLPDQNRGLFLRTFVLLSGVRLGLKFLPFQELRQRLSHAPTSTAPAAHGVKLGQIIWAVNISSRYMPGGAKCLAKALTTQALMQTYGYQPELKIGVAKSDTGAFQAHAWIEYQGEVVMGHLDDLDSFTPLPSLQEPRP